MDLIRFRPPTASAGKSLTAFRPQRMAICTSEGLAVPGHTGMPLATQYSTISGERPGETMAAAPAFTARSTCSVVSTVPAHSSTLGSSWCTRRMDSSAAAVRKVISATGRPPSDRALHSGTASSASLMAMTGTRPARDSFSKNSMIVRPFCSDGIWTKGCKGLHHMLAAACARRTDQENRRRQPMRASAVMKHIPSHPHDTTFRRIRQGRFTAFRQKTGKRRGPGHAVAQDGGRICACPRAQNVV